MPFVSRRSLFVLGTFAFAGAAVLAGAVWSGLYDVGADAPHTRPVHALLETVRDRSIAVRAADLSPPDLADEARIRHGAGNYDAMCADCHGVPGREPGDLQRGLYPAPPALADAAVDPRVAFWTIKHGIKASGMPAWGGHMGDDDIWNLVAFVATLPALDGERYAAAVAASGGHVHDGGRDDHHDPVAETPTAAPPVPTPDDAPAPPAPATTTHVHADGKKHVHAPEPAPPQPAPPQPESEPEPAHDSDDHHH